MNCLRRSNFDVLTGLDFEMPIMFRYCGRRLDVGRCEPRADMQTDQIAAEETKEVETANWTTFWRSSATANVAARTQIICFRFIAIAASNPPQFSASRITAFV